MEILAVLVVIAMAYMDSSPKPVGSNPVTKAKAEPTEPSKKVDRLYTSAKYLEDE